MNREAERHLDKAAGYLAKGDGWYSKAADEIIAAQEADPTLGLREIGRRFGKGEKWVRSLVAWRTTASPETPIDWQRGSHATTREIQEGARRLLAEAPLEQVERLVTELPFDRQQAIAAAAGDRYAAHRQRFDEEQNRQLTPAEQREREQGEQAVREHVARVAAPIQSLSIESLLEEATEMLKSMVEDRGVSAPVLVPIEKALDAFVTEFQVARGMVGLDLYERSDR